jgi:hypothetical protein
MLDLNSRIFRSASSRRCFTARITAAFGHLVSHERLPLAITYQIASPKSTFV